MFSKRWSLYGLFHLRRDDLQDVTAEEDTTPTVKRFFKILWRRFWTLITLNLMMLPTVLPLLIGVFLYLGVDKTPSQTSVMFPQLYGISAATSSPLVTHLMDLFGAPTLIPAYNAVGTYVGIGICLLFLAVTFGWQNCGAAYILRSLVRGEPVFIWSDYFYAVKRNFKQGFFLGLLDFAVLFFLTFDFLYFWGIGGTFLLDVGFFVICTMMILWFFMRFYLYQLEITFQLSIRKILKNALIFSVLGVKRNLMAALGLLLLVSINVAAIAVSLPLNFAIPLILPFFYCLSFAAFTAAYAAYPVIDRYMIAPFENQGGE